jgi:hypothetical protein
MGRKKVIVNKTLEDTLALATEMAACKTKRWFL